MSVGIGAASRAARTGQASRLFACLLALAALAQTVVLPMLDPRLIDFSPGHTHVVLGAANAAEVAWALAHHAHVYEQRGQPAATEPDGLRGRWRVVSSNAGRVLGMAGAADLTATPPPSLLVPVATLWLALSVLRSGPAWPRTAPSLPPPRSP